MPKTADQVGALRDYPDQASEAFRDQLRTMRSALGGMGVGVDKVRNSHGSGIDRSRELNPIARPTLRTMALKVAG